MKEYINLNYSKALILFALIIVSCTLIYTNRLVEKFKIEEQKKVRLWAQATKLLSNLNDAECDVGFILEVVSNNTTVPVIQTNHLGEIIGHRNIRKYNELSLKKELAKMQLKYPPIKIELIDGNVDFIYYKDSSLLQSLKYFPFIMFCIMGAFMTVAYYAFSNDRIAQQNKVWTGLAKETAHQIGTPLSSLMGWLEYLKKNNTNLNITQEIEKDIMRLNIIASRFSKIGSTPILKIEKIYPIIYNCVEYMKSRVSDNIKFHIICDNKSIETILSADLFEWVLENMIKNSVDAIKAKGEIVIHISEINSQISIEFMDNGKGIHSNLFKQIFKPGYTSKKRGWGLGLSLVKRIVHDYHNGSVKVVSSTPFNKTIIQILLNK